MKETIIACYAVLNDETILDNDKVSICIELLDIILTDDEIKDAKIDLKVPWSDFLRFRKKNIGGK